MPKINRTNFLRRLYIDSFSLPEKLKANWDGKYLVAIGYSKNFEYT